MKFTRNPSLAAALLGAAALLSQSCSHLRSGGAERIVLENGAVCAVVVPAFGGRVMSLQFAGGPNLLWTNPRPDNLMWHWRNHGGEKTWIGPQESWEALGGKTWPPPAFFDAAPYVVTRRSPTSVVLLSPADTNWNLRVSRTAEVLPDRLRVTSELLPAGDVPATRLTNWSVVQLPPPPRVAVRLTGRKRLANGMGEDKPLPAPARLANDTQLFDLRHAVASGKCSFDADLFLVEVPGGQFEIRQFGEPPEDDDLAIPDRAQLYFGARTDLPPNYEPYIEVEFALPHPASRQQIEYRFIPTVRGDRAPRSRLP